MLSRLSIRQRPGRPSRSGARRVSSESVAPALAEAYNASITTQYSAVTAGFDVARSLLWLAVRTGGGSGQIRSWDVADPTTPSQVGSVATVNDCAGIAYDPTGQYAYITNGAGSDGLQSYNCATAAGPSGPTHTLTGLGQAGVKRNVLVDDGDTLVVPTYSTGIQMRTINVSNPAAMVQLGSVNINGNGFTGVTPPVDVFFLTEDLILVMSSSRVGVINIATRSAPTHSWSVAATMKSAAAANGHVFVTTVGSPNVTVYDAAGNVVGSFDPGLGVNIRVVGGGTWLFVCSPTEAKMLDVTDPTNISVPGSAVSLSVALTGAYEFAGSLDPTMRMVVVSTVEAFTTSPSARIALFTF